MATAPTNVAQRGGDNTQVAAIRSIIQSEIKDNFQGTLGQVNDIVNIVNALIRLESKHNANAIGPAVSTRIGTIGGDYWNSAAINALKTVWTPEQEDNAKYGIVALGVMQVMGSNFVKGASSTGMCEIERLRPDLAGPLCVAPGESITAKVLDVPNLRNAIRAGLIILEGKYKVTTFDGTMYGVKGDSFNRRFPSRISAAVAAYLGLGKSDRNGTTPEQYAAEIVGGATYRVANGGGATAVNSATKTASIWVAATDGSNQGTVCTPGCCG